MKKGSYQYPSGKMPRIVVPVTREFRNRMKAVAGMAGTTVRALAIAGMQQEALRLERASKVSVKESA